jgi:hypothetical protein
MEPEAQRLAEESFQLYRGMENKRGQALAQAVLGDVALARHEFEEAHAQYEESLAIQRQLGHFLGVAENFERLARLALLQAEWETAARHLGVTAALRDCLGTPRPPATESSSAAELETIRANLGGPRFTKAWAEGQANAVAEAPTGQRRRV